MNHLALLPVAALAFSIGEQPQVSRVQTEITRVEVVPAFEPGLVSIYGKQFGLVQQVKIDGQVVPVVHKTGNEIVIDPGNWSPGMADLELFTPGRVVAHGLEFTPNMTAARNGNQLTIRINPGEAGNAWLFWSYACLSTPISTPEIYYVSMLDMAYPGSGAAFMGDSLFGEPLQFTVNVPPLVRGGLWEFFDTPRLGGTVNIQAFCVLEQAEYVGGEEYLCYSNMVEVPLVSPTPTFP